MKNRLYFLAKIHCISDTDSIEKERHGRHHTDFLPLNIIPHRTERTIRDAIQGNNEAFIQEMIAFAMVFLRMLLSLHSRLEYFRIMVIESVRIIDYSSKHFVVNKFRS